MPLADRTETPTRPTVHGAPCSVGQLYRDNLADEPELRELNTLLYLEGKNARQVWDELRKYGHDVAWSSINKHRGRNCRCFTIDKDICCGACRFDFDHCVCDAA